MPAPKPESWRLGSESMKLMKRLQDSDSELREMKELCADQQLLIMQLQKQIRLCHRPPRRADSDSSNCRAAGLMYATLEHSLRHWRHHIVE